MATMQSEMKEKEAEKDHQLKEVGGGHVWVVGTSGWWARLGGV